MYSDTWIQNGYIKSPGRHINSYIDYFEWHNEEGEFIGVTISFNLADDVHYELTASNWNKFLECVLNLTPATDIVEPLKSLFEIECPQIVLSDVLKENGVEFKKIAFY